MTRPRLRRAGRSSTSKPTKRTAPVPNRGVRPHSKPQRHSTSIDALLAKQPWSDLDAHILRAGVDVASARDALRRFARLVVEWNRSVSNLISKNDEARIVARHLIESIEPASWLAELDAKRWVDFGSGAGFPAIPLALLGVGEHWTLVESRRPKTLFMRKAIQEFGLPRIVVYHGRVESLINDLGEPEDSEGVYAHGSRSFDAFTSRATLRLAPTLKFAALLVRKGGAAFLWKGSRRHEELLLEAATWSADWEMDQARDSSVGEISVVKFNRIS